MRVSLRIRFNNKTLFFSFVALASIFTITMSSRLLIRFQTQRKEPIWTLPTYGTTNDSTIIHSTNQIEQQNQLNQMTSPTTVQIPSGPKVENIVLIAVNDNPIYLFPAMISAFFWRRRHNYSTLLITVGPESDWQTKPILKFASETFEKIAALTNSPQRVHLDCPKSMTVSLSQTVRVFAGLLPQISEKSWMMVSDSDCWTINKDVLNRYGKSYLFTNAKAGEMLTEWNVFMYTAHHIGMYVSQWRAMMGLPLPKTEKDLAAITATYVQTFFGLSMHNVTHAKRSILQMSNDLESINSITPPNLESLNANLDSSASKMNTELVARSSDTSTINLVLPTIQSSSSPTIASPIATPTATPIATPTSTTTSTPIATPTSTPTTTPTSTTTSTPTTSTLPEIPWNHNEFDWVFANSPTASTVDLHSIVEKALIDRPSRHMTLPPKKTEHTRWFMDQYLMAWKIAKIPDYRNDSYFESSGGKRIHSFDSIDCTNLNGIRDAHIKYSPQNWHIIQHVFSCFVTESDLTFIQTSQSEFEKLRTMNLAPSSTPNDALPSLLQPL